MGHITNWLPGMDSNHRHPLSESGVLPLNDPAIGWEGVNRTLEASFKDWRLSTNRPPKNLCGSSRTIKLRCVMLALSLPHGGTSWGDRRELNSRGWIHHPTPKPLGHGHIWCLRERSNLRGWLFRP